MIRSFQSADIFIIIMFKDKLRIINISSTFTMKFLYFVLHCQIRLSTKWGQIDLPCIDLDFINNVNACILEQFLKTACKASCQSITCYSYTYVCIYRLSACAPQWVDSLTIQIDSHVYYFCISILCLSRFLLEESKLTLKNIYHVWYIMN